MNSLLLMILEGWAGISLVAGLLAYMHKLDQRPRHHHMPAMKVMAIRDANWSQVAVLEQDIYKAGQHHGYYPGIDLEAGDRELLGEGPLICRCPVCSPKPASEKKPEYKKSFQNSDCLYWKAHDEHHANCCAIGRALCPSCLTMPHIFKDNRLECACGKKFVSDQGPVRGIKKTRTRTIVYPTGEHVSHTVDLCPRCDRPLPQLGPCVCEREN